MSKLRLKMWGIIFETQSSAGHDIVGLASSKHRTTDWHADWWVPCSWQFQAWELNMQVATMSNRVQTETSSQYYLLTDYRAWDNGVAMLLVTKLTCSSLYDVLIPVYNRTIKRSSRGVWINNIICGVVIYWNEIKKWQLIITNLSHMCTCCRRLANKNITVWTLTAPHAAAEFTIIASKLL